MKKLIKITRINSVILALAIFTLSCQKDESIEINADGKVSFGFDEVLSEKVDITKSGKSAEDATALIITIEDESGKLVYNQESLPLYNMNGSLITQAISLNVGSYFLTEFLVIDSEGKVIYIAPKSGSKMEYLVSYPLPNFFSIEKDYVTKLKPEVLSTHSNDPADFGYSTFSFDVVETFDFLVGVFIFNENIDNFEMTTASLTVEVEAEDNTVFSGNLEAATNQITLNDSYNNYLVTVEKDGFITYENNFTGEELKAFNSNANGPLVITLEEDSANHNSTVTDIDGNVYNTITIGQQKWMAENLKTTTLNDGTPIANATSNSEWENTITPAYAWQSNNAENKEYYGALYNWYAVDTDKLCPEGWRVPTDNDWYELTNFVGSTNTGNKLKSKRQVNSPFGGDYSTMEHPRWNAHDIHYGTDEYGFSALPGGFRNEIGSFGGIGSHGFWWSASMDTDENALRRSMRNNANNVHRSSGGKSVGFSVRCVKI